MKRYQNGWRSDFQNEAEPAIHGVVELEAHACQTPVF